LSSSSSSGKSAGAVVGVLPVVPSLFFLQQKLHLSFD
jgi:hypothetical protein